MIGRLGAEKPEDTGMAGTALVAYKYEALNPVSA